MSAFCSERSRPIIVDIAISAPARSIDEQATSTSRLRITSRIEMWCTSTSYIDFSSVSGSMPWDMVRLPCGSMSTHSTRCPSSANATARLSVVVVLATPPFWLANAITWLISTALFAEAHRNPPRGAESPAPIGRRSAMPPAAHRPPWRDHPPLFSSAVPALLDKRLLFVTGKGGVGKSTVAIALGLLAARRGLRTIVAELASQERMQGLFRDDDTGEQFRELELAPGLFTISIDPQHAMEEYLRVKAGPLGQALGSSRLFQAFAMATPGMRELLSIGKVWELAQLKRRTRGAAAYDLVIVDAPATGHGVGLLRTPRTFAEIARVGPIAHQGQTIADTIADPEFTGVIAVATPEEMPVNETMTLADELARDELPLDLVIVNALYPARFKPGEIAELAAALTRTRSALARSAPARGAVRACARGDPARAARPPAGPR